MSHTRASIDRKLDVLSARVDGARQRTRRSASIAGAATVALFVVWRWRRQQRASRQREAMNWLTAMKQVATVTRHESNRPVVSKAVDSSQAESNRPVVSEVLGFSQAESNR